MGRAPCCDKAKVKKGPWSPEEDATLKSHIQLHGTGGNWIALPNKIGLKRCGKSCRLRWLNYLRPNIKHGGFTEDEDDLICTLYTAIGSRWSIMAAQLPGRTDNDIKNYWNTKLKKKLLSKQFDDHPLLIMDQPEPEPEPEPLFSHSTPQQIILEAAYNINVWEINSAFQFMNINHYSSINLEAEGIRHAANAVPQLHISSSSSSSSSMENVTHSTYNSLIYQPQPNYQLWTSIFDDPIPIPLAYSQ